MQTRGGRLDREPELDGSLAVSGFYGLAKVGSTA